MDKIDYNSIFIKISNLIKGTYEKEIRRCFNIANPNIDLSDVSPMELEKMGITGKTSQLCFSGFVSLNSARELKNDEKIHTIIKFSLELAGDDSEKRTKIEKILLESGIPPYLVKSPEMEEYDNRHFHYLVIEHSKPYFKQGNYFHAAFEVCKAYIKELRDISKIDQDGATLCDQAWNFDTGALKVPNVDGSKDSQKNFHNGLLSISKGVTSAFRNPTAHEPEPNWKITKEDCLDILSTYSFLFRQLDKAVLLSEPN